MSRLVVIKIGSNSLAKPQPSKGELDQAYLNSIAEQVVGLSSQGYTPVIVSSGATSTGLSKRGMAKKPVDLFQRQALAAIGQITVVGGWEQAFAPFGVNVGQLLVTFEDFCARDRNLNFTSTLRALIEWKVVPIINENDCSVGGPALELTIGDNDQLSAIVASQIGAEMLVILTDVPGVYDKDPRSNPDAQLLSKIPAVTLEVIAASGEAGALGRGGMRSKVESARVAAAAGVTTVIALARESNVLQRAVVLNDVGTTIPGLEKRSSERQRWLAIARKIKGVITVDDGAASALLRRSNLLCVGIVSVSGDFHIGDTVSICSKNGGEIARGLAAFTMADLSVIKGKRNDEAERVLGHPLPGAAVHRDDILLTVRRGSLG